MKLEVTRTRKDFMVNPDYNLRREEVRRTVTEIETDHEIGDVRIWQGRAVNYNPALATYNRTIIQRYFANLTPELASNPVYYANEILYNLLLPRDTNLCLVPWIGVVDIVDKRTAVALEPVGGALRVNPLQPGSRLEFSYVLRHDYAASDAMQDMHNETVLYLWQQILAQAQPMATEPIRTFADAQGVARTWNTAQLLMAASDAYTLDLDAQLNALATEYRNQPDQYREAYLAKAKEVWERNFDLDWTRDFITGAGQTAQLDYCGYITNPIITGKSDLGKILEKAWMSYRVNVLPLVAWLALYRLTDQVKPFPRRTTPWYSQVMLSSNKYVVTMRPNTGGREVRHEREATQVDPVSHAALYLRAKEVIGHTDVDDAIIMNLENRPGQFAATETLNNQPFQLGPIPTGVTVFDECTEDMIGSGQPQLIHRTRNIILPEGEIVPRLYAALADTKATFLRIALTANDVHNVLVLPDAGYDIRAIPLMRRRFTFEPAADGCEIKGSFPLTATVRALLGNDFRQTGQETIVDENPSLATLFGF